MNPRQVAKRVARRTCDGTVVNKLAHCTQTPAQDSDSAMTGNIQDKTSSAARRVRSHLASHLGASMVWRTDRQAAEETNCPQPVDLGSAAWHSAPLRSTSRCIHTGYETVFMKNTWFLTSYTVQPSPARIWSKGLAASYRVAGLCPRFCHVSESQTRQLLEICANKQHSERPTASTLSRTRPGNIPGRSVKTWVLEGRRERASAASATHCFHPCQSTGRSLSASTVRCFRARQIGSASVRSSRIEHLCVIFRLC